MSQSAREQVEAYWQSVYEPVMQPSTGIVLCLSAEHYFTSDSRTKALAAALAYTEEHKRDVAEARKALALAQPILYGEVMSLCESYCPPCEEGEVYDYSELTEPELGWITTTEAALDAVDAALPAPPEADHAK